MAEIIDIRPYQLRKAAREGRGMITVPPLFKPSTKAELEASMSRHPAGKGRS